MTRFGLDSTSPVSVSSHHAVGSTVALRYLSRYSWKVVSHAEHEAYKAAGIGLALVFEDSATNALNGKDTGRADAEFARNQAFSILGKPAEPICIRFAVDYDASPNPAATDPYFDGVAEILGKAQSGPYGGKAVVSHQADRGFKRLWQTYAWSGGQFDQRSGIYQYSNGHTVGGVGVDYNHIYPDDYGQYDRKAAPPPDPHHYLWFTDKKVRFGGGHVDERVTVEAYDKARSKGSVPNFLRQQLLFLALQIKYEVVKDAGGGKQNWNAYHRGWRFQQLTQRAAGKKLV